MLVAQNFKAGRDLIVKSKFPNSNPTRKNNAKALNTSSNLEASSKSNLDKCVAADMSVREWEH